MLRISAAVAIPAVIRDVHKNLRAVFRELPHFIREDRFITNKYAQLLIASLQWSPRLPAREVADFFSQSACEPKPIFERQVLTERHQVHFVVTGHELAVGADQRRRIEDLAWLLR